MSTQSRRDGGSALAFLVGVGVRPAAFALIARAVARMAVTLTGTFSAPASVTTAAATP